MAYCTRCRTAGTPAVALYTSSSGGGTTRQGAACERHREAVRAWVGHIGPVTETTVRAPPSEPERQTDDQQALF